MRMEDADPQTNVVSGIIVDEAIHVHRSLGPGLYEWVYETCLERRLQRRGLGVERQVHLDAYFEGERLEKAGRVDLVVDSRVFVELKATRGLEPSDFAQLRTYLRMGGREVGLLINFHSPRLKDGLFRVVVKRALS